MLTWKGKQIFISPDEVKHPHITPHLNQMIHCQICLMVLQEPHECDKCQNQFCLACTKTWEASLKANYKPSQCPLRCKPAKYVKSHKFVRSMLEELAIDCPNVQKGCAELVYIMKLENHEKLCMYEIEKCKGFVFCQYEDYRHHIQKHEDACIYIVTSCEYCQKEVQKRGIRRHHDRECEEFPKTCEFCDQQFPRKVLKQHRWYKCEMYPESCQYCEREFLRKDLSSHEAICELKRVKCDLCYSKIPLLELQKHLTDECPEEIALLCTQDCKLRIKRKNLDQDGAHNCNKYLMSKLYRQKSKVQNLKNAVTYTYEVEKAFSNCVSCPSDLQIQAKRPIAALKQAFQNISSIFISTNLYQKEKPTLSVALQNQLVSHFFNILKQSYLNLEAVAIESQYKDFTFVERQPQRQVLIEEEKKQEVYRYVEADIFGFRMDDEELVQEFRNNNRLQNLWPVNISRPQIAYNPVINHNDNDYDDDGDEFIYGIFGDETY